MAVLLRVKVAEPGGVELVGHSALKILTVVLIAASTWFAATIARAATLPIRDAHAAAQLHALRERAGRSGHSLWEVRKTEWSCVAGQRAICVNVISGAVASVWFAERSFAPMTFVLVSTDHAGAHVLSWIEGGLVEAAHRDQHRNDLKQHARTRQQLRGEARSVRVAAKALIRDAEHLLDRW